MDQEQKQEKTPEQTTPCEGTDEPNNPYGVPLPPKRVRTKEGVLPEGDWKVKFVYIVKTAFILALSAFLLAISSYSLIAPNDFATGGVTGIAIILEKATQGKIIQSISVFCINFPLIILSFFFVKIFAALAGGIGIGASIGFAFKIGGSTGGMDIVAVMVQRKRPAPSIAWMIFMLNCVVIAASFFVYKDLADDTVGKILPLIMAACEQYVESKTNDAITNGFNSAIEFRVVTDKPDEMALAIISRLGRGVTSIPATGMYTRETHAMLVCVVNRRQITTFRKILKEVDPNSFAVMTQVSQVLGLGFFSSEH